MSLYGNNLMKLTSPFNDGLIAVEHYPKNSVTVSPLSLYSAYQSIDVEYRCPNKMLANHWHGQIEINIPFGDDVEYIINGHKVLVKNGHVALFWASMPHRLIDPGKCEKMGIINIPMHHFLSWTLNKEMVNQITHGLILQSLKSHRICESEIQRWRDDLCVASMNRVQLIEDEIALMLKRFCLDGWEQLNSIKKNQIKTTNQTKGSKHGQFYVSQMLYYIATHHDVELTIDKISNYVDLNKNYAMGLFQKVMKLTIKQYIIAMRINHARALLTDTDRTILDISLTVGFISISRFYVTFQKIVGITPKKYRQLSRIDDEEYFSSYQSIYPIGACHG